MSSVQFARHRLLRGAALGALSFFTLCPVLAQPADQATKAPASAIDFKVSPEGARASDAAVRVLRDAATSIEETPQTVEAANDLSDRLTHILRQGGFPIGQVVLTEQDWRAAQQGAPLVFTAFPGLIRKIDVENKSRVKDVQLQKLISKALCDAEELGGGCLLQTSRLERTTQLLQDVPGVAISKAPQFSPGTGVGAVNVLFSLEQRGKPFTGDVFFDNKGIESTGLYRLGVSGSGNNYFGLGESYALSLTGTNKKMWTGSVVGGVPIFHDGLRMTGGFTRQQYVINSFGRVSGVANTVQAGMQYPISRGLDTNIWTGASYLHSRTSTELLSGDAQAHSNLNALRLSLQANNGDRPRQLRSNIRSGEVALTVGHRASDESAFSLARRDGSYAKITASGFGTYGLNKSGDIFLSGQFSGQYASRNLDPSEKLGVGGPNAVRAYRVDEGSFDDGGILNLGLYKRMPIAAGHQIQVGAFSDLAIGRVNHNSWLNWETSFVNIPGIQNKRVLAGYGLSVDWLTPIGATVSASVSKAYGFSSNSWVDPGKKPLQYWLSLTWSN